MTDVIYPTYSISFSNKRDTFATNAIRENFSPLLEAADALGVKWEYRTLAISNHVESAHHYVLIDLPPVVVKGRVVIPDPVARFFVGENPDFMVEAAIRGGGWWRGGYPYWFRGVEWNGKKVSQLTPTVSQRAVYFGSGNANTRGNMVYNGAICLGGYEDEYWHHLRHNRPKQALAALAGSISADRDAIGYRHDVSPQGFDGSICFNCGEEEDEDELVECPMCYKSMILTVHKDETKCQGREWENKCDRCERYVCHRCIQTFRGRYLCWQCRNDLVCAGCGETDDLRDIDPEQHRGKSKVCSRHQDPCESCGKRIYHHHSLMRGNRMGCWLCSSTHWKMYYRTLCIECATDRLARHMVAAHDLTEDQARYVIPTEMMPWQREMWMPDTIKVEEAL